MTTGKQLSNLFLIKKKINERFVSGYQKKDDLTAEVVTYIKWKKTEVMYALNNSCNNNLSGTEGEILGGGKVGKSLS